MYTFPETGYELLAGRPRLVEAYFEVLRGGGSYGEMWRSLRGAAAGDLVRSFWPFGRARGDLVHHYDRRRRAAACLPAERVLTVGLDCAAVAAGYRSPEALDLMA